MRQGYGERLSMADDRAKQHTDPYEHMLVPWPLKAFGVLCIIGAMLYAYGLVRVIVDTVGRIQSGALDSWGVSAVVVDVIHLVDLIALVVAFVVLGIRLIADRRRYAAQTAGVIIALLVLNGACAVMLYGVDRNLAFIVLALALSIAFQVYVDPELIRERRQRRREQSLRDRDRKREGVLGRDETGRGYISLNFFNLFWIFVICSVLGLAMETLYHFAAYHVYQDRAGMLFGPFSPIYGVGAVLMTVALNRLYRVNPIIIFLASAVIGGAFEYFTSWFMQYAFGVVAWNYTGMWLSIGGRTCGPFMAIWGVLGVVWIKLLLPLVLKAVNLIPWNWRYWLTAVCALAMTVNIVMTLEALDCWYERASGKPVVSHLQQFYDEHFDDDFMANRFQTMTIHPEEAARSK